ncbi:MAG: copper homeostasis protein CutC [Blastocatellia bacterium]
MSITVKAEAEMKDNSQPYLLEVIACSVDDALAAERGGADRLEIISRYDVGGLTPPVELVGEIATTVKIPLRVMLRETEAFEVHDEDEKQQLCESAREFAGIGIDGLVLGFLKDGWSNKSIDHELVARVLACAPNLKATFHRAVEDLDEPLRAIAELKRHSQIDRILTSGGGDAWQDKVERFTVWQQAAQSEIEILVGGGTDVVAIKLLKSATGIREFHIGRAVREGKSIDGMVLAKRVRELADLFGKSLV